MAFTTVLDAQPDMRPVGDADGGDEAVRLARQLCLAGRHPLKLSDPNT
ncbi:hypothetical protein ACFC09_14170 [Streptomyces sp. NPDC056161]